MGRWSGRLYRDRTPALHQNVWLRDCALMPPPSADSLLRYIRRLAGRGAGLGTISDAEALRRFVGERDEAAFELLVWRYGGMVLRVCRGILHDEHAAEDAFQATFFVLARNARTGTRHTSLAGWLYQVAYRIALRAQAQAKKHRGESPQSLAQVAYSRAGDPVETLAQHETEALIFTEVNRLPAKYREPVVLCCLHGLTHEEAARQLGWPVGTVSGRLARARARLQKRLTARGLVLPAGVFAAAVVDGASVGAASVSLIVSTTQAALRFAAKTVSAAGSPHAALLAEGVLKVMLLNRLKVTIALVLAMGIVGAGAAWQAGALAAPEQAAPQAATEKPAPSAPPSKRLMRVPSPVDGIIAVIGREIAKEEKVPADQIITLRTRDGERKYRRLQIGDHVKEGEVLALLDDPLARTEVAIEKAKVEIAKADYEGAVKRKLEAQARLDRADRLVMEGGRKGAIVSSEDYAMAVLTRDSQKWEEDSKKAALDVAKLNLERAEINLEKCVIRAPVQGTFRAIYKERGEAVQRLEPVVQLEIMPHR
jgi:RNA polymerase sigma factor (sigma-70 family)